MTSMVENYGLANTPKLLPYEYEDFTDMNAIRLLKLLPAESASSEVEIELSTSLLADLPEYEALSYTWATEDGDASLSGSVICSRREIKVTKNCEVVLRRLREQDRARVLWVDAISINQMNIEERSHQVAIMGSIYSQAARVSIWLGDSSETVDPETGLSISALFWNYLKPMIAEIRQEKSNPEAPTPSTLYEGLMREGAIYVTSGKRSPLLQGFLDVVLRPWWQRVWVVQEAAFAKSIVVICGALSADYLDFYDFCVRMLFDNSHDAGLTWSLLDGFKHHMDCVFRIKERVKDLGCAKVSRAVFTRSRRLSATDERDHIFALLDAFGALKSELLVPDYKKTTMEVFADLAQRFFEIFGSFDILVQATNVVENPDIPSWVPNWAQRPQFHTPVKEGVYHASGISKPSYKILNGGWELKAQGACVDVLERVSKAAIAGYKNPYIPSRAILGYQESCRVGLSLEKYRTGESAKEATWRTLCWNVDGHYQYPATGELGKHFENFHKALTSGKEIKAIERALLEEAAQFNDICVHSMPLCVTSNGYLASVPWTAQRGDQIVILAGSDLPFVLRPHPTSSRYRLMGACYVHGIMDGQAFPSDLADLDWFSIW